MLVHTIKFNVKGTIFDNEEGKDIQKEIKRVLKEYKNNDFFDEFYNGYTNSEIKEMDLCVAEFEGNKFPAKLVGDEYNGEDCFKIYLKTYNDEYIHIGYAPKEHVQEIAEWLTKEDITVQGTMEIVGGKYKYCELYEEDYEEKERIATKELNYGAEIVLSFCDKTPNPQKQLNKKDDHTEKKNKYFEVKLFLWFAFYIFVIYMIGRGIFAWISSILF